jgi:predicted RND superfamily exporter protein
MEHYKISDNLGLRMIDIQYNINDYLPRDYEYKFNHAFQSNHKEYVDKLVLKAKTDDGLGGDDASYKELISSLSETIREKET